MPCTMWSFVVLPLFLPACVAAAAAINVLVLGGNGFIGSETVYQLMKTEGKNMRLTLLNRGSEYWDSGSTITPHVNSLYCDRNKIRQCRQLTSSDEFYDFVLDFSSYRQQNMAEIIDILTNRVGLYIYISTDSVYEVCQGKDKSMANGYLREEDAVRPASKSERQSLNERDDYGHRKLGCEELLVEQRENGGFPYVLLRLPDVIGPRDNTDRWWMYQLWIQFHKAIGRPLYMTKELSMQRISLVYNVDVARVIVSIMKDSNRHIDSAFNLAFSEVTTLAKLLLSMAEALKLRVSDVEFSHIDTVRSYLFPTVTRGPLSIEKAQRQLKWKPTPLQQAIRQTVTFYRRAMKTTQFAEKRRQVLDEFKRIYVAGDKHAAFVKKLAELYPYQFRDEL